MAQQYQPGQRWISDSEAELGLGTVLAQDGRLLTVLYPATGDTRQYALRNAPLTRVRFSPGDSITHFEGWKMTVQEVDDVDGLLVYHGLNGQNEQVTLPETQLSNFIQFRLASDRLFAGQIDPLAWFSLRYHTLEHTSRQLQSSLWGLGGVRAQPIAHQLHIAREVADRIAPRVLLADEVVLPDPYGLVKSRALRSRCSSIRLPLNISENRNTAISHALSSYRGSGVHHIAFECDDLFAEVSRAKAAGVPLLDIPLNYYDDLAARFDFDDEFLSELAYFNVLYDRDAQGGELFHVYTEAFEGRFFFELLQRKNGYAGYGAANVPVRLAAMAKSRSGAVRQAKL